MASKVTPAKGEKVYRMTDSTIKQANGEELLNTTGNIVNFKCDYAKDFSGTKYMKQDKIYKLHVIHAEKLEAKGIGKIQKDK
jgi:hypothetical protein